MKRITATERNDILDKNLLSKYQRTGMLICRISWTMHYNYIKHIDRLDLFLRDQTFKASVMEERFRWTGGMRRSCLTGGRECDQCGGVSFDRSAPVTVVAVIVVSERQRDDETTKKVVRSGHQDVPFQCLECRQFPLLLEKNTRTPSL